MFGAMKCDCGKPLKALETELFTYHQCDCGKLFTEINDNYKWLLLNLYFRRKYDTSKCEES